MTVELEVNSGRLSRPVRLLLLEHLAVVQSLLLAVALPGSTGVVSTRNLVGSPLSLVSLATRQPLSCAVARSIIHQLPTIVYKQWPSGGPHKTF